LCPRFIIPGQHIDEPEVDEMNNVGGVKWAVKEFPPFRFFRPVAFSAPLPLSRSFIQITFRLQNDLAECTISCGFMLAALLQH
jgi:hypothetical protein